ncbi:MAG: DUF4271 domain-containing protein [Prevotella sp.]|nr:DUF4271 domain-containing protein [Prevotella sp.]
MARQDTLLIHTAPQAEPAVGAEHATAADTPAHTADEGIATEAVPADTPVGTHAGPFAASHDAVDSVYLLRPKPAEEPREITLRDCYDENIFFSDSLYHPEIKTSGRGVAGDPVPYTLRGDNMITSLLLACVVMVIMALSRSRRFIVRQIKDFARASHSGTSVITETSSEVRFQFFLVAQTCLLLAVFQYFYTLRYIGETFLLPTQYHLIAIYFGMYAGYFLLRVLLYSFVNYVFFSWRQNMRWLKSFLFLSSSEGVLFLPVVLLQVYFDLSIYNVIIYFIIVLVFVKILTIYKCYAIFFSRDTAFLQIILYFCALEAVPIAALWGALVQTGSYLEINF